MMNWVLFDAWRLAYDLSTARTRPLGGSQSALCYLAAALARRGHRVTAFTGTSTPQTIDQVECLPHRGLPIELLAKPNTIVVVLNGPADLAMRIRRIEGQNAITVLWTQHAHDQPAVAALRDSECAAFWDRIVCVSDWQRVMYERDLGVQGDRMVMIRNAIAPAFEKVFGDAGDLADAKAAAPWLAYTSTPFRGLDVLIECFPKLRQKHPACRLDVYSSMAVYGQGGGDDEYQHLYEMCRATEGIAYWGSLAQPELAAEMRGVHVLAYPNTFAETSCIAVMEALAAGALVVTSELGALPESCGGFARLVAPIGAGRSREAFELDFLNTLSDVLIEIQSDAAGFAEKRFEQVQAINAACTWELRAAEWEAAARTWMQSHGRA